MNNDLTAISAASETDSTDPISPNTNYSRWMTDMAADIARLKLSQLAIPGAHNSGVDMAGTWGPAELLGACQNNSFSQQLAAGARYLDLRLEDRSYRKQLGNFAPEYVFVEKLEFTHGNDSFWYENPSAGRTPADLVRGVKHFIENNPREIVILDVREFKRMWPDSGERALRHFEPIKNLLIPKSASNLTIGEIRQLHPGRSIILCFEFGQSESYLWRSFKHQWHLDASEERIESLVVDSMRSPLSGIWVLSAAVRTSLGPKHLGRDHSIRKETFKQGFQNANIVMVDFIERPDTQVSVTDKCIALNKLRAVDDNPPSVPAGLVVTKIREENLANSFTVKWEPSTDDVGVVRYEVYMNESRLVVTNETEYKIPYIKPHTNHSFKVRAFDFFGTPSAFSQPFRLEQDVTSPTIPGNFRFSTVGFTSVNLSWDASSDDSGIAGYELRRNGILVGLITVHRYYFTGLVATEKYTFDVRAKDNNGLYSSWTTLTLEARPVLKNPKVIITEYSPVNEYYRAVLMWDKIAVPQFSTSFTHNFRGFTTTLPYQEGVAPNVGFGSYDPGEELTFTSSIRFDTGNGDSSEDFIYTFTFDPTRPENITDLKLTSRTPANTSIAWTPSVSKNVSNYAISLNGGSPKLVPASDSSYVFEQMPTDEEFLIEVWAVSSQAFPSIVESITALRIGLPGKPGPIQVSHIAINTVQLYWDQSTGNVASYEITLNNGAPFTVANNRHTFADLAMSSSFNVEVRALNSAGEASEPSSVSFNTNDTHRPTKPGVPVITHNTGTAVVVGWAPSTDNVAVTAYEVVLDANPMVVVETNAHTFVGLKDKTTYTVHVRARDAAGNRSDQSSATFTTKDITPPSPPGRISITNVTSSTAGIHWMPSTGDVDYYEVTLGSKQPVYVSTNSYSATGLTEGTLYSIAVRAQDAVGNFSTPSFESFTTKTTRPPSEPGVPVATDITETSARLNWAAADGLNVRYTVWLNGTVAIQKLNQLYLDINNLQSDAEHFLEVAATNEAGTSEKIATAFRTKLPLTAAPGNFRWSQSSDTTILEWDAPDEPVTGYRVILINPQDKEFTYFPVAPTMRERLPENSRYRVRITARSAAGESTPLIAELTTK